MSKDEFKITEHNPPTPEQILQDDASRRAWAQLIAGHIKCGLESGTWVIADGKAVPVAMLHFYQEDDIMAEEETCEPIAR